MIETIFNIGYFCFATILTAGACYGLFRASRTFLLDADKANIAPVRCVTRMLTVAFCLLMCGYIMVTGPYVSVVSLEPSQVVQVVTVRFGFLLVVTGVALLTALFVLSNLRKTTRREGNRRESILA